MNMLSLLRTTAGDWRRDHASLLAGSVAYHALFALAPVLLLVIAVAGLLLSEESAQREALFWMRETAGADAERFVESALRARDWVGDSWVASVVGAVLVLFAAVGLLGVLRSALNVIWKIEVKPDRGVAGAVVKNAVSFLLILVGGTLLLVSAVASALITVFLDAVSAYVLIPGPTLGVLQLALSYVVAAAFFVSTFKLLPDARLAWKDAAVGSLFTAALFVVGTALITRYFAWSGVVSAYGAAGSLVAALLWIYYSSNILLLGAIFTKAYAAAHRRPIRPAPDARRKDEGIHVEVPHPSFLLKTRVILKTLFVEWLVLRWVLRLRAFVRRSISKRDE